MWEADDRARLLDLLRREAVLRGEFVLASGRTSDYYIDARRVTLSAAGIALVGAAFESAITGTGSTAVAGLTVGADPIVAAIALTSQLRGTPLDGLIVRKQTKIHGTGRRIEGPWREGLRVAVVDDTLTTGASSLEAAAAVEEAGGEVTGVWALIDREQGAQGAIERAGYRFQALFTASELLAPSR